MTQDFEQHPSGIVMAHLKIPRTSERNDFTAILHSVSHRPGSGFLDKFPFELSGGQRQREANACAPAVRPALLVADKAGSFPSRMDPWDVRCLFSLNPESRKG